MYIPSQYRYRFLKYPEINFPVIATQCGKRSAGNRGARLNGLNLLQSLAVAPMRWLGQRKIVYRIQNNRIKSNNSYNIN